MRGWVAVLFVVAGCAPDTGTLSLFCESCTSIASVPGDGGAGGEAGAGGGVSTGDGGSTSTSTSTSSSASAGDGGSGGDGGGGFVPDRPTKIYSTSDHPRNIACAGASICWTETESGDVRCSGRMGESPTTIVTAFANSAVGMVLLNGDLAIGTGGNQGRIDSLSMSGQSTRIVSAPGLTRMRLDDGLLYWADSSAVRSQRGLAVSTSSAVAAFDVVGNDVYWTSLGDRWVHRTSASDGSTVEIGATAGAPSPSSLYVINGRVYVGTSAGLVSFEPGNTIPTSHSDRSAIHVITDGTRILWVEAHADPFAAMALRPDTGDVQTLGTAAQIDSLAVCDGRAYWASYYGEIWTVELP